jgi:hypothetical protein
MRASKAWKTAVRMGEAQRQRMQTAADVAAAEVAALERKVQDLTATPAQYLENIFQVALTLPPLETSGYQRLLRTLVGTRLDQISPSPAAMSSPVTANTNPQDPSSSMKRARRVDMPWTSTGMFGITLPPARVVERVDPLTLGSPLMSRGSKYNNALHIAHVDAARR